MQCSKRAHGAVSSSDDDDDQKTPTPARPHQQRLEASFKVPLVTKRRKNNASKIPATSVFRSSSIRSAFAPLDAHAAPFACGIETHRKVVDLFCCIGGFSCGAAQAGHSIALGVDCDAAALAIHEANHPNAKHLEMFLGPETELRLIEVIESVIEEGEPWHLHGSPPCTKLSGARAMGQLAKSDIERGESEGMSLVNWFLDLVGLLKPTSWSMEQVAVTPVKNELSRRVRGDRATFDYEVVELAQFGVPQTRTRVFAGSPALIARIRFGAGMRVPKIRSIRDAIPDLPDGAVYLRGNWHRETNPDEVEAAANGEFIHARAQKIARRLDEPAWTAMSSDPLQWWDERYARIRSFNTVEMLAVQSFPTSYKPGPATTVNDFLRGIGNAVPPLFAQKLMSVSV